MLTSVMSSPEPGGALAPALLPGVASEPALPCGLSAVALQREAAVLRPVVRSVVACVLGEHRDHPDVEDCTHEALRRAFEGASRLREGEPVRPWLLGIARHVAIDARRKRRREQPMAAATEDEEESWVDRLVDPAPGPDDAAANHEQLDLMAVALNKLAAPQRKAMVLFHVEGHDYQRIAAQLDVPMGTVATWLARGRRALADALRSTTDRRTRDP